MQPDGHTRIYTTLTDATQSMGLARGMGREDGKRDYASDRMNRHRFGTAPSSQSQKSEQDCP